VVRGAARVAAGVVTGVGVAAVGAVAVGAAAVVVTAVVTAPGREDPERLDADVEECADGTVTIPGVVNADSPVTVPVVVVAGSPVTDPVTDPGVPEATEPHAPTLTAAASASSSAPADRRPVRSGRAAMAQRSQTIAGPASPVRSIPMSVPHISLTGGVAMPQLGLGVWRVPDSDADAAVSEALRVGYRSIDTAAVYGNEAGVGRGIAGSDVPRQDIFLTTKLANSEQGHDSTLRAFDKSLDLLGTDYVDLYLIHWPQPQRDDYVDTWRAFGELQRDGRVRAIGVSNFTTVHLSRLIDETGVVPAVNQIELHPYLAQREMRAFHVEHGIATEAWSPLGQGGAILADQTVTALAEKYARTPAQVVLRWHVQHGTVVIPKSVTPSRIAENIDVFDFELADDDMAGIDDLDRDGRLGSHPDNVG
jgi:diketogulonate reductase-like aldo/keto reductase